MGSPLHHALMLVRVVRVAGQTVAMAMAVTVMMLIYAAMSRVVHNSCITKFDSRFLAQVIVEKMMPIFVIDDPRNLPKRRLICRQVCFTHGIEHKVVGDSWKFIRENPAGIISQC